MAPHSINFPTLNPMFGAQSICFECFEAQGRPQSQGGEEPLSGYRWFIYAPGLLMPKDFLIG